MRRPLELYFYTPACRLPWTPIPGPRISPASFSALQTSSSAVSPTLGHSPPSMSTISPTPVTNLSSWGQQKPMAMEFAMENTSNSSMKYPYRISIRTFLDSPSKRRSPSQTANGRLRSSTLRAGTTATSCLSLSAEPSSSAPPSLSPFGSGPTTAATKSSAPCGQPPNRKRPPSS